MVVTLVEEQVFKEGGFSIAPLTTYEIDNKAGSGGGVISLLSVRDGIFIVLTSTAFLFCMFCD